MNLLGADFNRIAVLFSIANTPTFIFYKFREDAKIQAIANKHAGNELIKLFGELFEEKVFDLKVATNAYALLMAMTLKKEWLDIKNNLDVSQLEKLKWAKYLVSMASQKMTTTRFDNSKYIKPTSPIRLQNISTSSSYQDIQIERVKY